MLSVLSRIYTRLWKIEKKKKSKALSRDRVLLSTPLTEAGTIPVQHLNYAYLRSAEKSHEAQGLSRTAHSGSQHRKNPAGLPAVQTKTGESVNKVEADIRLFDQPDIPEITGAFEELGWEKPASQYERYLREQLFKIRVMYIGRVEAEFSGYLTICWQSSYRSFRERNIPEIMDFNVLPKFRRLGIGTQLMDKAETEIAKVSPVAGIGVGMTSDYGEAQRLYVLRGYVPDGNGLYYRGHPIQYGKAIQADDNLALYLTKKLR